VVKAGEVESTTLPLPVVEAVLSCDDELLPRTAALAGTLAPLTLTTVAACEPVPGPAVTSPVS
jgi:hypothetical protein